MTTPLALKKSREKKQKHMKKITITSVRKLLIILLVAQSINLSLFYGVDVAQKRLSGWIYETYSQPFLK